MDDDESSDTNYMKYQTINQDFLDQYRIIPSYKAEKVVQKSKDFQFGTLALLKQQKKNGDPRSLVNNSVALNPTKRKDLYEWNASRNRKLRSRYGTGYCLRKGSVQDI